MSRTTLRRLAALVILLTGRATSGADLPDFEREVAPILNRRCLECHSGAEPSGKLDLSRREGALKGGDSGPAIVPGKAEDSLLLDRVRDGEMPPLKRGVSQALPEREIQTLSSWVASGAPWPNGRVLDPFETTTETRAGRDWWSLQPVRRPSVPSVHDQTQVVNPVDAFVVASLEQKRWALAPEADRRTLIRRLYDDLVGFPPTYEDVVAFEQDRSIDAYERLVDRLLACPHFGERWGRHWLDVARYAETCGYERDQEKPNAWKYRDWVIQAFNEDLPYNRFIVEQLAGDEVPDRSPASLVATGFLRLGTWNDEPNDPNEYKYERLEDMVHTASTAFLGMTVKCARCHDHKFDPIRQTDYYRVASAFWAGPIEPGPRDHLGGPEPKLLGTDVLGWTDRGREASPLHLLKKGDPTRPGPVVEAGFPSMVASLDQPVVAPPQESKTTTRRLQLARWITDARNPLTARVWVNRVWQYHMGQGLVRSPDNFGFNGEKPTHPGLLDWLASELVEGGWATKPIHRLIVLSRTYRQASIHADQDRYAQEDAGNRLWWHAERRRLDAESLRDSLLAASGGLDRSRLGGPGFRPNIAADALEGLSITGNAWKPSPEADQRRRAVYVYAKRGLLSPLLTTFDFSDTTLPCGKRDVTLVPTQALALLNNEFVHEQSERLARRISGEARAQDDQIHLAWRRVLGRDPRPSEFTAAREHLASQASRFAREADPTSRALASLCHVLMNTNEFLYLD